MTIVEFLRARLDEDEAAARELTEHEWRPTGRNCQVVARHPDGSSRTIAWCDNGYDDDFGNSAHIARHDPARVLREVEAKRAIVEELAGYVVLNGPVPDDPDLDEPEYSYGLGRAYYDAAKRLAAVYSDHPDYDTAWTVELDN